MKIEIEFDNSYEAKMVIDGREMKVVTEPGCTRLVGAKGPETDETLGGIVARELYSQVSDIQKAWASVTEEQPAVGSWDRLDDATIDAVEAHIW